MASSQIATIPSIGNIAARPQIRISTATLPGLIQTYAMATEVLPYFCPMPDRLLAALDDDDRKDHAIFMLQQGAKAMNALECLEDGTPDALDHARTLITGIMQDLYRQAEKGGAE